MKLNPEETSVLNNLFYRLFNNGGKGVVGSWQAKRRFYEPTYIYRKNLIFEGEKSFCGLYLLWPIDKEKPVVVTPIYEDKTINQTIFPIITNAKYSFCFKDDGAWWDTVREEIPLMLAEFEESLKTSK